MVGQTDRIKLEYFSGLHPANEDSRYLVNLIIRWNQYRTNGADPAQAMSNECIADADVIAITIIGLMLLLW